MSPGATRARITRAVTACTIVLAAGAILGAARGAPRIIDSTGGGSQGVSMRKDPPAKLKRPPKESKEEWETYRNGMTILEPTDQHGRQCVGLPDNKESNDCRIQISPVRDSRYIPWRDLDENGYVVARLKNRGTRPEAMFGIQPKQVVYWRVYRRPFAQPDGSTIQRMVTQFIDRVSGQPVMRPDHVEWAGLKAAGYLDDEFPLRECHQAPENSNGERTVTRLASCTTAAGEHARGALVRIASRHNSPSWITCLQGCCSVEGGP